MLQGTRILFDNGGGATLYREQADGTGKGFYYSGSSSDAKALAGDIINVDDCDWNSGDSYSATQVFTAEEIEKIKNSSTGWEEEMSIEEFKRAELPPFSGGFCKDMWFETQKQMYFSAETYKEKQEIAQRVFEALDSQEFLVLDDEGVNMCEASLKHFSAAGVEYYAYQDNITGYEILRKSDYKYLSLVEKK